MRKQTLAVGVLWLGLTAFAVRAKAETKNENPTIITVNATGEVRVRPDVARLLFSVAGQGASLAKAQEAHDKLLGQVKAKMAAAAGDAAGIEVTGFDIRPVQTNYGGRAAAPSTVGYRVTSDLDVVLDLKQLSLNRLTVLAQAGVDAGATLRAPAVNPYGSANPYARVNRATGPAFIVFALKDPEGRKLEALRRAVAAALPKAKAAAEALGGRLGGVQSVRLGTSRVFHIGCTNYYQPKRGVDSPAPQWSDMMVQADVTIDYAVTF